ncbi:molybdate ABC transporter substrate-binding protein [Prodigiosinella confusarubida]|uniref:Molybdate ABC transporter substrate-binding protein n=1 Tax=Serratia sp. (strain ATCC 39006) TaxID=104623 RepID=A0A2I5TIQ7_SERS3|nr:molybdate ABC transporter substrate-binding protein [Serratia sp. ATCC 39006]AUH00122.1 molybdate ABC transporter substrate-binding protein [Serratia sp. ATCC 39006]AUH04441.1 molybdate ABC transporter substrate-binding protein [Serratia sp. ATCC 39006]
MNRALRVFAAGSLRQPFSVLLKTFTQRYGVETEPTFGPAGLLCQQLMSGGVADLFASADCGHPLRLQSQGMTGKTARFATNQLCIVMRNDPALTGQDWLSTLLDSRFTLSTSTPGSDPGGDYAHQFFDRIECLHPGKGNLLRSRAKPLLGAGLTSLLPAGTIASANLILTGQSDIHIGYANYIPQMRRYPELHIVKLAAPYAVTAEYMLATLKPEQPEAVLLARYLLSETAQCCLAEYGFGMMM